MRYHLIPAFLAAIAASSAAAHDIHAPHDHDHPRVQTPWEHPPKFDQGDLFRQLEEILPTPDEVRLASGAPGPAYWQQQADHVIDVSIDPQTHLLTGSETITYHNNSPHDLEYLWVQLDQNRHHQDSAGNRSNAAPNLSGTMSIEWLKAQKDRQEYVGGASIHAVKDRSGNELPHTIVGTMMRLDLPTPLLAGRKVVFSIDWSHEVPPQNVGHRSKRERLDDGHFIYEIAQWFPRMAAYTDVNGWQHKQFIGRGEFTLEFGNYLVRITVPETFIVAATGELQNDRDVLTAGQRARLTDAATADRPQFIITPEEATANESLTPDGTKTWIFRADQVRDFAWAASPSFIWDAWGVEVPVTGDTVMCMSFYPIEGEPLWSRYSTQAIAQTIEVYSRHAIPYPYPTSQSINGPVGGMEYPMITFNGPRPEEDGTYTSRTKRGLIGVIIHEVGHNWFPMIINSDERQWTWLDEGFNTFVQFLAEQGWEEDYPSRRGEPRDITSYMASERQRPIMTNSESLLQFGSNAYAKPATALNVLRETILGRALFDHAFATYCRRWAFKRPQPADFFRTMEDASGVDLDWFWRGWFYSTDHCDIAVEKVERFRPKSMDPDIDVEFDRADRDGEPRSVTQQGNDGSERRTDRFPELIDFYSTFDDLDVTDADRRTYRRFLSRLERDEEQVIGLDWNFHVITLRNVGGLIMPVILHVTYEDGSTEMVRLPAEIWKHDHRRVSTLLIRDKEIARVQVDPFMETADTDLANNTYPPEIDVQRFGLTKSRPGRNDMQRAGTEGARDEALPRVQEIVVVLVPTWSGLTKEFGVSPADASDDLLPLIKDLRDPWNHAMTVELSATATLSEGEEHVEFCIVRSIGRDGEPGTDDDLAWTIFTDGEIQEREDK